MSDWPILTLHKSTYIPQYTCIYQLQVDLLTQYQISGLITQGSTEEPLQVTQFTLQFGMDLAHMLAYEEQLGTAKVGH